MESSPFSSPSGEETPARARPETPSGTTALLVDDDSQTRSTFSLAYPRLRLMGAFANVEAALAAAPKADVAVLDLQLSHSPGSGGLQGTSAVTALVSVGVAIRV